MSPPPETRERPPGKAAVSQNDSLSGESSTDASTASSANAGRPKNPRYGKRHPRPAPHASTPTDRFTWEREIRSDPAVTGTRLLVLLTLGTWMHSDGTRAHPGQKALADQTGQSERTVRQYLGDAVAAGWLVETYRGHRLGDGTGMASEYRAASPEAQSSTGSTVPVEDVSTGRIDASTGSEQTSTGSTLPPTGPSHCSSAAAAATVDEKVPTRAASVKRALALCSNPRSARNVEHLPATLDALRWTDDRLAAAIGAAEGSRLPTNANGEVWHEHVVKAIEAADADLRRRAPSWQCPECSGVDRHLSDTERRADGREYLVRCRLDPLAEPVTAEAVA